MKPFVIISDPGIDDLVALFLLKKLSQDMRHCLVATFGNAPLEATSVNAKQFISFIAPSWTYLKGARMPLSGRMERPWPDYFHGPDGVWGIHPDTDTKSVKVLQTHPKFTHLLSLGPMTDVCHRLQLGTVNQATVMGGAFRVSGNETEYAEANIAFDPDAAAKYFALCKNIGTKVIPLDVTQKVTWSLETVKQIPENSPQMVWIKKVLLTWFDVYSHDREEDFCLHDPLAVYLTFFPEKAIWTKNGVRVVTEGEKRGQTLLDQTQSSCEIAFSLHNSEAIARDIFAILFGQ